LQFYWFDHKSHNLHTIFTGETDVSEEAKLVKDLWVEYAGTVEKPDSCQVYGGWLPGMKAAVAELPGVHYSMQPPLAGYLKPNTEGTKGPPIIFVNMRESKPGSMPAYGAALQKVADWWIQNAPGLLACFDFVSEESENVAWDLRVMANLEQGFLAHAPISSYAQQTLLPLLVSWFGTFATTDFKNAVAFSPDGRALIAANSGNAAYTHYTWEEGLLGPMPNFAK